MLVTLLVFQLAADCQGPDSSALQRALHLITRGDDAAAAEVLATRADAGRTCETLRIAQLSLRGWHEARALSPKGGAAELLGPVNDTLDALRRLAGPDSALEVEYAETSIRAAIAAAQDERPEMELLLIHARDLAERLQLRDRRAQWPRAWNLLAGELWFEVDRYEEARRAYERALRGESTPLAIIGLARAQARLGDLEAACATYRRAADTAPSLRALAARELAGCR